MSDRVGAILSSDDKTVKLFGYGVYLGHRLPPDFPVENPCIRLDSGQFVWGYECWWGPEEKIRTLVGDKTVEMVDLSDRAICPEEAPRE